MAAKIIGMDLVAYERSLEGNAPPAGLTPLLQALWYERKGDWTRAHDMAQDIETEAAAWVHAYLHRREGDLSNAAYWYRQAQKPVERGDPGNEWRAIVVTLLRAGT